MKPEGANPRRYVQDGLMIYSSGTLHHQKNSCRGYLYKRPEEKSIFNRKSFYKRYFVITKG